MCYCNRVNEINYMVAYEIELGDCPIHGKTRFLLNWGCEKCSESKAYTLTATTYDEPGKIIDIWV